MTGPYRKVYTTGAKPIPAEYENYETGGTVTIACNAGQHKKGNGDGPNAYLGGWSTTPDAKYGNADAGILYNLGLTDQSENDYSPFMNIVGVKYIKYAKGTHKYDGGSTSTWAGPTHIPCDTGGTVDLSFDVEPWYYSVACEPGTAGCNSFGRHYYYTVALQLTSDPQQDVGTTIITWVAPTPPQVAGAKVAGGWGDLVLSSDTNTLVGNTPCGGCVFKWMTTIGQKVGHPDYRDGATYSATWSDRYIDYWVGSGDSFPLVPLKSNMVFCSEYPLWYGTYDFGKRDCTDTPPNQNGTAQSVEVTGYSPEGEADAISLTH